MFVWMPCKTNNSPFGDEWAVTGISGSHWSLWVGSISAKSAPNLSKNGFATNQIMTRKASPSYSHVCMDAMQDKQQSIQVGADFALIMPTCTLIIPILPEIPFTAHSS